MNNNSVFNILKKSQRPLTSKEIILLVDCKNNRSISREIKSLTKRDMIIRVEIKIPKCQKIVMYQLKKGSV